MDDAGVGEGFGAVADAFAEQLDGTEGDAAALTVFHHGRRVVDLWAGMGRDDLMVVASCSKGVTATVIAMLVERGVLDPEAPVADYWPEYAAAGKAATTVGMVASHTAGLPYPPLGTGLTGLDLHRGPAVTAALAAAEPLWEPGTAMAYHPVTYGTLLDEIVRRASGRSISDHVRELLADPLGVDAWVGLPGELVDRVVPGRWAEPARDPRAGHPTADRRGRNVDRERNGRPGHPFRSPSMPGFGPRSFGHTGAGGRLGLADPDHGIGFGWICSRMTTIGPAGDPRWAELISAVRSSLDG